VRAELTQIDSVSVEIAAKFCHQDREWLEVKADESV
jgi:hypothetical protein